jgi:transcriptional regulator with XRE-family HTH domain
VAGIEKRKLEFGDRLRNLHDQAGLTGRALAQRLGWQSSKVSRIVQGKQTPTDSDLRQWLSACGVSESVAAGMANELRELRLEYSTWRRQLRGGMAARQQSWVDLARSTTRFRIVESSTVPGLVQTPEYARHVFRAVSDLHEVPRDVDEAVAARMQRQEVLYDPTKWFEILVFEAALRYPIAPAGAMAGQIDRLMTVAALPSVRFGVITLDTVLPHVPMHGYWIADDAVLVEMVHGELTPTDPDELALYNRLTDRLWTVAVTDEAARAVLVACTERWAVQARRAAGSPTE